VTAQYAPTQGLNGEAARRRHGDTAGASISTRPNGRADLRVLWFVVELQIFGRTALLTT